MIMNTYAMEKRIQFIMGKYFVAGFCFLLIFQERKKRIFFWFLNDLIDSLTGLQTERVYIIYTLQSAMKVNNKYTKKGFAL